MTEREFFKTFYDLAEDDLNIKNNKTVFVKNTIMANIIKNCKGETKKRCKVSKVVEKNAIYCRT